MQVGHSKSGGNALVFMRGWLVHELDHERFWIMSESAVIAQAVYRSKLTRIQAGMKEAEALRISKMVGEEEVESMRQSMLEERDGIIKVSHVSHISHISHA